MPRIIDNIETKLDDFLRVTLEPCTRADMCVGYFNLRGWRLIDDLIDRWAGEPDSRARVLVGMQAMPYQQLKKAYSLNRADKDEAISQGDAVRLKNEIIGNFAEQLGMGAPSEADEAGLRRVAKQLRSGKLVVKLFLRHNLHAKLYLMHRPDAVAPIVAVVGSSNLTLSGLAHQGELNVDVVEGDAANKLQRWFDNLWGDHWCLDITEDLAKIIEQSWARAELIPPHHIYLKIAYHLSNEARTGIRDYRIPREFEDILFEYQKAAVKIAAHHLYKRGGAIVGDVVGLGKTLLAIAVARLFQDELGDNTLVLCPPNLQRMWQDHIDEYRLAARIVPISQAPQQLPELRPFQLIIIDESHNLRNRESKRYRAIREYLNSFSNRVMLLSATPYNKSYSDLSAQLRLFLDDDEDLGIRPEAMLRNMPEHEFIAKYQVPTKCLRAFEKSEHPDDWRELMRLFMIRRTRTFIKNNYAKFDKSRKRHYLELRDGSRRHFPVRQPKAVKFAIDDRDAKDQYARLFSPDIVDAINELNLPRYGLGNYINEDLRNPPSDADKTIIQNLSRAGKYLMGFCRTNLFKRLESSGVAFLMSLDRHILRNHIFIYALEQGLDIPIGTQDSGLLYPSYSDNDDAEAPEGGGSDGGILTRIHTHDEYRQRAVAAYRQYSNDFKSRFQWLDSRYFQPIGNRSLADDLGHDAKILREVLELVGVWDASADNKLAALIDLATREHPHDKLLLFSQFTDTVRYLHGELQSRGIKAVAMVTGDTDNPTDIARRFSPLSNRAGDRAMPLAPEEEVRILLATDVLSEGQNLQDAHIVLSYDLPWAIIRLIQRVGRVDRIGQKHDDILAYTFLPADGVEQIIHLRQRLSSRLRDNAEVVGTDEQFFDDDKTQSSIHDLYHEKAGILDGEDGDDVDLSSYALQIWKNATDKDPSLSKKIKELPNMVYTARAHHATDGKPQGVISYIRTRDNNDALIWTDSRGRTITESQLAIIKAVECDPDTPAAPRASWHHRAVAEGARQIIREQRTTSGALGGRKSARYRAYTRLANHLKVLEGDLFIRDLERAVQDIYDHPLRQSAIDTINRVMKMGVNDHHLAQCVVGLNNDDKLCLRGNGDSDASEPVIICSMGLVGGGDDNK